MFQEEKRIIWSRPPHVDREFIDDCNNHQPIDKVNKLVLELTGSMSQFFSYEDARAAELIRILRADGILVTTPDVRPSVNCKFLTNTTIQFGEDHLISILAEIGSGLTEPFAQAV